MDNPTGSGLSGREGSGAEPGHSNVRRLMNARTKTDSKNTTFRNKGLVIGCSTSQATGRFRCNADGNTPFLRGLLFPQSVDPTPLHSEVDDDDGTQAVFADALKEFLQSWQGKTTNALQRAASLWELQINAVMMIEEDQSIILALVVQTIYFEVPFYALLKSKGRWFEIN
jgi:hypothetical protein